MTKHWRTLNCDLFDNYTRRNKEKNIYQLRHHGTRIFQKSLFGAIRQKI